VDATGCQEPLRAILLGASNPWFPVTLSALAIPTATGKLQQLVEGAWTVLEKATNLDMLRAFRLINQLPSLAAYSDEDLWAATEMHLSWALGSSARFEGEGDSLHRACAVTS